MTRGDDDLGWGRSAGREGGGGSSGSGGSAGNGGSQGRVCAPETGP